MEASVAGRLLGKGTGETRGCGLLRRWAPLPPGWLVAVLGRPHPLPGPGGGGQPHLQSIHADSSTLSPRRYCPNFLPCHQRTPLMMTSGSLSPTVEIHVYMQMSEFIYSQIHFKNRALNIQAQGRSVNAASGMSLGSHFSRRRWSP